MPDLTITRRNDIASAEMGRHIREARRVFAAKCGPNPLPLPCWHCNEPITERCLPTGAVAHGLSKHHINYDPTDNRPENVVPSHHGCNSGDLSPEGHAGRSVGAVKGGLAGGRKGALTVHAQKLPDGRSAQAAKAGLATAAIKLPDGRSAAGVRGALTAHIRKLPNGCSAQAVKNGLAAQAIRSSCVVCHREFGTNTRAQHERACARKHQPA